MNVSGIRVGLNLTVQYAPHEDPVAVLADHLRLVAAVRDAGWDSVFVAQHYLSEGLGHVQPVPLLGRLAAMSGQMRLGAGICLLSLQNPVAVAEDYATIDVITGGRLIFGAGLGYRPAEQAAFAVADRERVRRFVGNLGIVRRLWEGESVDADLPWCHLDGARLTVRPVQRPRPPIWVAANSDAAVARAARLGDAWMINPHARIGTVTRQLNIFHAARQAAGLGAPAAVPLMREVVCAPDRATAVERASRHLAAKYLTYRSWGQGGVLPADDGFEAQWDDLVDDRFAIGDPAEVREMLREWCGRTGATDLILRVHWAGAPIEEALESVELLSRQVLPQL